MEELVTGKFKPNFAFLKWFRKFFQANMTGQVYNPLEARNGQEIAHAQPNFQSPQRSKSPTNLSMSGKTIFITKIINNPNIGSDLVRYCPFLLWPSNYII